MESINYYELLGINQESDWQVIKETIDSKVRELRSLLNNPNKEVWQEAEKKLKVLLDARQVLLDPSKRARCDLDIKKSQRVTLEKFSDSEEIIKKEIVSRTKEITVTAKCQTKQKVFYIVFGQDSNKRWVFKQAYIPIVSGESKEIKDNKVEISNFDFSNYSCPVCGSISLVKCGQCNQLACQDQKVAEFHCPWCSNAGKISGTFDTLSGSENEMKRYEGEVNKNILPIESKREKPRNLNIKK